MDSKILISLFCWAQNITYFGIKICTLIEYNIIYVMIIFLKLLKMSKFKISKVQNLAIMEPKLQMVALQNVQDN
jgi:hypothetical protein